MIRKQIYFILFKSIYLYINKDEFTRNKSTRLIRVDWHTPFSTSRKLSVAVCCVWLWLVTWVFLLCSWLKRLIKQRKTIVDREKINRSIISLYYTKRQTCSVQVKPLPCKFLFLCLCLCALHSYLMASITGGTATWSPSSLQIRLAFSTSNDIKSNYGRKFPTLLHLRPAHLDRRVRLLCVAQKDPIRVGSDGLPGCSNSEKKESYGGEHTHVLQICDISIILCFVLWQFPIPFFGRFYL